MSGFNRKISATVQLIQAIESLTPTNQSYPLISLNLMLQHAALTSVTYRIFSIFHAL